MNLQEMPACGIITTASSAANHVPSAGGSIGTISSGVEASTEAQQFRMASREAGGISSRCNAFLTAKQCFTNIVKRYNNSVKNDQRCFSISLAGTGTVLAQNKVKICLKLVLPTDNAFADPSQASTTAASLSSAGNHSVKLLRKPAENPFLPSLW